jgi:hypothetical protein
VAEPPEGGERAQITYRENVQEWRQAPGGKWWVGFERECPPRPQDLARPVQLPGHPVELGDGNTWLVPVARRYQPSGKWRCALDRTREIDGEGAWCMGPVVAKHAALWEYAERLQAFFEKQPGAEITGQEEANRTVDVLAANYRVGTCEVTVLRLLTNAAIVGVVDALLDRPGLKAIEKKLKGLGVGSTSPGDEA